MNWFRTILDGVAMSAVFNSYVAVFWLLKPHSFITMFPKDLQKRVRPVTKEEIRDVYDSDLFDRLQKDFMRGRDAGFIA